MGIETNISANNEYEGLSHNCAITAFWFRNPAKNIDPLLLTLVRLQHRGQEGVGIGAIYENGDIDSIVEAGHVREIFIDETPANIHAREMTNVKILVGHNRYSTSGDKDAWQPFASSNLVLAHNGNLTNPGYLLARLPPELREKAKSDTWILNHAILNDPGATTEDKITNVISKTEGAFSLVISDPKTNALYAVRDPWGFRPLYYGKLKDGNGYMVSSETVAFQRLANNIVEVKPGQGIRIKDGNVEKFYQDKKKVIPASCIFELIYFSSPASEVFGINCDEFRNECGRSLAREDIKNGFIPDVILPVRNSGVSAAHGYSQAIIKHMIESGKYTSEEIISRTTQSGILTNQFNDRVFIEPGGRKERIKYKFVVNEDILRGQIVVVIDDSIIRGDTISAIDELLREGGAKEVHTRIASPPARYPCFMGIDFPSSAELIAYERNIPEICMAIGANSLNYLSLRQMIAIAKRLNPNVDFCNACFSGEYPLQVNQKLLFGKGNF